jgi:signal peptidase I
MKDRKGKYISQEYSTQTRGRPIREGTKTTRRGHLFVGTFFSLAVIIGVSLIAFTVVFFYSGVNGTSMMRTLNASGENTDSVVVNRYIAPKRGHIIVLNHYKFDGTFDSLHIKRLLATGGERVCFIYTPFTPEESAAHPHAEKKYRYRVEINDVEYDNDLYSIHEDNIGNYHYDNFYAWQEGLYDYNAHSQSRFDETGKHDAAFRDRPDMSKPESPENTFRFYNEEHKSADGSSAPRWEILLPAGFMFYMGDNRGGNGSSAKNAQDHRVPGKDDLAIMSADSTFYGMMEMEHIVGVVIEIIHSRSATQWFIDKVLYYITLTLYRPNSASYEKPH